MDMLAVFCSECTESGMIVSLGFDSILIVALARAGLAVLGGGGWERAYCAIFGDVSHKERREFE